MYLCIYRPPRRRHRYLKTLNMFNLFFVFIIYQCGLTKTTKASKSNSGSVRRSMFSPRMQYDDWTPLGHGDPLKNDPTFDYVPPVLERVHYWVPPGARTPDPPRSSTPSSGGISSSTSRTIPVLQDRYQDLGVTKVRPQYIPVYYQYRPTNPQRPPYTILVPPPPDNPLNYPSQQSISVTPTTLTTTDFWETQLATIAPTTQSHYNFQPMQDVTPAPSVLHYLLHSELASTFPPSTLKSIPPSTPLKSTTTTTNNPSLTTDPLFSHYKQPNEPLRGPMYLIIQGHSKVKTYGPAKIDKISGIPVQETNEVSDSDDFKNRENSRR